MLIGLAASCSNPRLVRIAANVADRSEVYGMLAANPMFDPADLRVTHRTSLGVTSDVILNPRMTPQTFAQYAALRLHPDVDIDELINLTAAFPPARAHLLDDPGRAATIDDADQVHMCVRSTLDSPPPTARAFDPDDDPIDPVSLAEKVIEHLDYCLRPGGGEETALPNGAVSTHAPPELRLKFLAVLRQRVPNARIGGNKVHATLCLEARTIVNTPGHQDSLPCPLHERHWRAGTRPPLMYKPTYPYPTMDQNPGFTTAADLRDTPARGTLSILAAAERAVLLDDALNTLTADYSDDALHLAMRLQGTWPGRLGDLLDAAAASAT